MIFQNCYAKFHEPSGEWNLRQFWNITSGIYAKYHVQIMLLFVYTSSRKRFVIFICRYFKLSWNITALSQSNGRNFSCSCTTQYNYTVYSLGSIYSGNCRERNIVSTSSEPWLVEEKGVIISSEIKIFLLYLAIPFPWF